MTATTATPRPQVQVDATAPVHAAALSMPGLLTILLGVFLPMTDFFIVNVALPTIQGDLHSSTSVLELVVSGYATMYAVLLVLGGRLGDTHGRRRMFVAGMAGFTLASLLCGLAPTAGLLVAARALQGATAAMMVPQTLSTIQASGDLQSRSRALGWYGATGGLAAVAGQVLGGVLVSADLWGTGWRMIFLVNVPVGLAGLALTRRFVPETRAAVRAHLDLRGTVLLAATLVALLIPLTEGRSLGWPVWSWVLLALVPLLGFTFLRVERAVERGGRSALVPPSVVAHASMRKGLLMAFPFFMGFGAFMFVYALLTQGTLGFTPLRAGLALAPLAVVFLVTSLLTTRWVARWGRSVITVGALVQLVGLVLFMGSLQLAWPHVTAWDLQSGLIVMGIGQGLTMSPLMRVVLADVPTEIAGAGSGVLTTTQQTALALGVATLGSLYLTLEPASHLGAKDAALLVVGIQAVVALGLSVGSRRLP